MYLSYIQLTHKFVHVWDQEQSFIIIIGLRIPNDASRNFYRCFLAGNRTIICLSQNILPLSFANKNILT